LTILYARYAKLSKFISTGFYARSFDLFCPKHSLQKKSRKTSFLFDLLLPADKLLMLLVGHLTLYQTEIFV